MADMSVIPTTFERIGETALRVVWADGHESLYPWPLLRTQCPCAVCRPEGRGPASSGGSHKPYDTPVAEGIRATAIKPVGRYAIHIAWSDGHQTGIYAFDYLRQLCPCEACRPTAFDEG